MSAPKFRWRERVAIVLEDASHETWIALVDALGLSRTALLAKVPGQARKRAPPPPPPKPDPRPILDHAVRAAAEDFEVSSRKVRAAFAQLVVDLERLGLSYAAARDVLLGRSEETKSD